ncbi:MAG: nitrile hydratase subunit beta [Actinomycetota bacterium]
MSGVHDLGGQPGFGTVPVDDDAIFHADWERRAFGVTQFAQVLSEFNTDAFRHGIEREDPATYRSITYFDKWIRNGERMLVEGGVIPTDAVVARIAGDEPAAPAERTTDAVPNAGRGSLRSCEQPARFAVGDRVRVAIDAGSRGHTRLPDYVAGRTGTIALVSGSWIFPDTHAHGDGESPTWVYAVAFDSGDLWPEDSETGGASGSTHTVHVDLFEPYLEPVT